MYLQLTTRCNMTCEHCLFACTDKGVDISLEDAKMAIDEAADVGDNLTIGGGEPTMHPQFWDIMAHAVETGEKHRDEECPWVFIVTNGKNTEDALALAWLAEKGVVSARLSRDPYHDSIDNEVIRAFNPQESVGWKGLANVPKSIAEALGYDEDEWYDEAVRYEAEEAEYEEREPNEIDRGNLVDTFWEIKSCDLVERWRSIPYSTYNRKLHTHKGYNRVSQISARGRGKNVTGSVDECACNGIMIAADGSVWQCGCKRLKLADDVTGHFYQMTPNYSECSESETFKEALEVEQYA